MHNIADIMCPTDTRNLSRLPRMQAIYNAIWAVAVRHEPKSIFEIGVRGGYSAYALIIGSGAKSYIGCDVDDRKHYGGPWLWWAEKVLKELHKTHGVDWELLFKDSQAMTELPGTFDLIHVDGDHTFEGCLHDMELCWPAVNPGGVMVVDDSTYLPGPIRAVHDFTAKVEGAERVYLEQSPTGSMVYVKAE